eukprot:296846-Pelagomonas_calceolata.AAC.1
MPTSLDPIFGPCSNAARHWQVWDYVGDNYVHRLIQSKTDGKLVEVPSPGPQRPQVGVCTYVLNRQVAYAAGADMKEVLMVDKIDFHIGGAQVSPCSAICSLNTTAQWCSCQSLLRLALVAGSCGCSCGWLQAVGYVLTAVFSLLWVYPACSAMPSIAVAAKAGASSNTIALGGGGSKARAKR